MFKESGQYLSSDGSPESPKMLMKRDDARNFKIRKHDSAAKN